MENKFKLLINSTHHERSARIGEKIGFFPVLLNRDGKLFHGTIEWTLFLNEETVFAQGVIPSCDYTGGVTFISDTSGYYKCNFTAILFGEAIASGKIGVMVAPEMIHSSLHIPDDFLIFWEKHIARIKEVPPLYNLIQLDSSKSLEAFELNSVSHGKIHVRGILVRPSGVRIKLPAILLTHGAGVRSAGAGRAANWAAKGFLALEVNAHGIENGREQEWYDRIAEGVLDGYRTRGFYSGDPGKVYYLAMFLRIFRALEILSSMPEWDGKNLWTFGGSQGAWQALAGAALMKKVSGTVAWIPAGCDIYNGGWPLRKLIGQREKPYSLCSTIPYFDCCGFCAQIKDIPVFFSVGLIDEICKADGVMAAYNSLKTNNRHLSLHAALPHETQEYVMAESDSFVMNHLR